MLTTSEELDRICSQVREANETHWADEPWEMISAGALMTDYVNEYATSCGEAIGLLQEGARMALSEDHFVVVNVDDELSVVLKGKEEDLIIKAKEVLEQLKAEAAAKTGE